MAKISSNELVPIFCVDTTSWCIYNGCVPTQVTQEAGRICFWFPKTIAEKRQAELSSGQAMAEVTRWASVVKSVHSRWLRPEAKAAMRSHTLAQRQSFDV